MEEPDDIPIEEPKVDEEVVVDKQVPDYGDEDSEEPPNNVPDINPKSTDSSNFRMKQAASVGGVEWSDLIFEKVTLSHTTTSMVDLVQELKNRFK